MGGNCNEKKLLSENCGIALNKVFINPKDGICVPDINCQVKSSISQKRQSFEIERKKYERV